MKAAGNRNRFTSISNGRLSGRLERKRHQHLVMIFVANFESPALKPVLFEPVGVVKAMGCGVRSHDGHANLLDQGPGMRDDPLHQRRRQSAPAPEHVRRRRASVRDQERYVIRTVWTGLRHVDKYVNMP